MLNCILPSSPPSPCKQRSGIDRDERQELAAPSLVSTARATISRTPERKGWGAFGRVGRALMCPFLHLPCLSLSIFSFLTLIHFVLLLIFLPILPMCLWDFTFTVISDLVWSKTQWSSYVDRILWIMKTTTGQKSAHNVYKYYTNIIWYVVRHLHTFFESIHFVLYA